MLPSHLKAVSSLHGAHTYTREQAHSVPNRPVWCSVVQRKERELSGVDLPCDSVSVSVTH